MSNLMLALACTAAVVGGWGGHGLLDKINPSWIGPLITLALQLGVLVWLLVAGAPLWLSLVMLACIAVSALALKHRVLYGRRMVP